jgi:hypothetical protein
VLYICCDDVHDCGSTSISSRICRSTSLAPSFGGPSSRMMERDVLSAVSVAEFLRVPLCAVIVAPLPPRSVAEALPKLSRAIGLAVLSHERQDRRARHDKRRSHRSCSQVAAFQHADRQHVREGIVQVQVSPFRCFASVVGGQRVSRRIRSLLKCSGSGDCQQRRPLITACVRMHHVREGGREGGGGLYAGLSENRLDRRLRPLLTRSICRCAALHMSWCRQRAPSLRE